MAKKQVDPLKAKQKKQKIILAVLGVAFLGLMVFQVPRVMKQLHPAPPPTASATSTTTATPTATPTLAAPTLGGAEDPSGTATGSTGSLASTPATTLQDGQLSSFSRFASKDPFSQQLSDATTSAPSSSGGSSGGGTAGSGGGTPAAGGHAPAPGSAVISVNGIVYTVPTGTNFPQATGTDSTVAAVFHLVSATANTATIAIAGGSYATGAKTVTLHVNKPVTLMNTADGTRYVLILKPLGTAVSTAGSGTSAAGGTSAGGGTGASGGTSTTPATVTLPAASP